MLMRRFSQGLAAFAATVIVAGATLSPRDALAGDGGGTPGTIFPAEQSPQEFLDDGLAAKADRQVDLARQLFEQLILAHPGTGEAERAADELRSLDRETPTLARPVVTDPDTETSASDETDVRQETRPAIRPVARLPREAPASRLITELRRVFVRDVGDRVFFAENSATIGGRARAMLENQTRWLKARPETAIKIIGRADDGGSQQAAKDLSTRRAGAVRDHFLAAGIAATRITLDARGDSDPLATCRTFMCQAQNRLAETLLMEPVTGDARSPGEDAGDDGATARGAAKIGLDVPATVER